MFRWFLDMNLVEPSFDATTFTKNRKRLLEHEVGKRLFDRVVAAADEKGLLSDEHFTVDGTLIEAAASLKSFKRRDGDPPTITDGDPGNPSVNFHGEKRSNATHQSTTDPHARLMKKGKGDTTRPDTRPGRKHGSRQVATRCSQGNRSVGDADHTATRPRPCPDRHHGLAG